MALPTDAKRAKMDLALSSMSVGSMSSMRTSTSMAVAVAAEPTPSRLASRPDWYRAENSDPALAPAKEAFQQALEIFASDLTKDGAKVTLANSSDGIYDLLAVVKDAQRTYDADGRHDKTHKWLVKFSKRVSHYGNIMDVLCQHNPEYVSLAWGAMKFLFTAVINHHNLITALSKGLAQIAGALPKMELTAVLYPTERMKQALADIYASIIQFLIRANGWFKESRLSRAIHSITRPTELRYDDLLLEIETSTKQFDSLAMAASHAEQRDIHLLLLEVKQQLIEQQQLNVTAHFNTNLMLSDLQFSNILTHVSNVALDSPEKTLQLALYQRNRARARTRGAGGAASRADEFWLAPKFRSWTAERASSLIMIQGTYALRTHVRDFLASMVECVRAADVPILWALRTGGIGAGGGAGAGAAGATHELGSALGRVSVVDVLKYLTSQALRLRKSVPESAARTTCARFQTATTEREWVELLAASLTGLQQVYVVVDVELVSAKLERLGDGLTLPAAFWLLFRTLEALPGASAPAVKVVLVSYGSPMFQAIEADKRDFILPIRGAPNMKRPAQRQHTQGRRNLRGSPIPVRGRGMGR